MFPNIWTVFTFTWLAWIVYITGTTAYQRRKARLRSQNMMLENIRKEFQTPAEVVNKPDVHMEVAATIEVIEEGEE